MQDRARAESRPHTEVDDSVRLKPVTVVPPGWPAEVSPPTAPDWERSATAWLFDLCPPDYRQHEVLRRHPLVLARLATRHVEASLQGARTAFSHLRVDLRDVVGREVLDEALSALEQEGARLLAVSREVALVEHALRGGTFRARL